MEIWKGSDPKTTCLAYTCGLRNDCLSFRFTPDISHGRIMSFCSQFPPVSEPLLNLSPHSSPHALGRVDTIQHKESASLAWIDNSVDHGFN